MSFKSLACAVSAQRQEIKQALTSISYFDTWDTDVVAECCRVSSVAEYPSDTIILGPGTGTSHTVFFILEGICKMVQNMHVEIRMKSGRKEIHKIHRLFDSKTLNSDSTTEEFASKLLNQKQLFQEDKNVETVCGIEEARNGEIIGECSESKGESRMCPLTEEGTPREPKTLDGDVEGNEDVGKAENSPTLERKPPLERQDLKERILEPDRHLGILEDCSKRRKEAISDVKKGSLPEKPKNVESLFVQTGFLLTGACFGLDQFQKNTFIMAVTKVKCLKIPRRFLFRHNPNYTWNRILLFHSLNLPKEEDILESLRSDREWTRTKEKLSADIVALRNIPNHTLSCDVPYSLRLARVR